RVMLPVPGRAALSGPRVLVNDARRAHRPNLAPGGDENRPAGLIHVDAVAQERAAKHGFLNGAELLQRAVAAAVLDRRLRFQAAHAEDVEREVEDDLRRIREDAGAPVVGAKREAPFGDIEGACERADLEETDDGVRTLQRHAEGERLAGLALTVGPCDE